MKARKLSVNRLADFSGLGRGHLAMLLSGKSSPTLRTMVRLAEALEVDVRDLLPETEPDRRHLSELERGSRQTLTRAK